MSRSSARTHLGLRCFSRSVLAEACPAVKGRSSRASRFSLPLFRRRRADSSWRVTACLSTSSSRQTLLT